MTVKSYKQHEVGFCAEVSKWSDAIFTADASLPFDSSEIESFGRGSLKRQDFRVYERKTGGRGKPILCGEVKLPGTPLGRSPFDATVWDDAFDKATKENCRYFFTWNVEHLALFDRSLWDTETLHERCIGKWDLGQELNRPEDVTRPEVIREIRDRFLPKFFYDFAEIFRGRKADALPPVDEFYVSVLETHLGGPLGPVRELRDYLADQADRNRKFDARLREWMTTEQQWNFDRTDPRSWREVVDRAARSMVYVLSNRILFYQAVRLRNRLPELKLSTAAKKDPQEAFNYLRSRFEEAVDKTGDYEPVFFPHTDEWPALVALSGTNSLEAWDRTIRAIERFNFKEIPTDILGGIFQQLISPEERHKFGQFYTDESIVDVINAFCIRRGEDAVLDPACGSGSFLVRSYYRKYQLDKTQTNQELLEKIYGCDINAFPAHLATLNLAARNIANEENYPRISRRNFFTVGPNETFCELPMASIPYEGRRDRQKIALPELDAVIGNPPYVRQEHIPKAADLKLALLDQSKEHIAAAAEKAFPGINLSKQSDLHLYFWPVAAQFLKPDGWFGFLTSSSWLDAKYGFALQRWILSHFRLVAIIESVYEPWFEDARVKTAATILQRCDDGGKRDENLVRFVRLKRPLLEILQRPTKADVRAEAATQLRDLILKKRSNFSNDDLRIMVKPQGALWSEGLSVARMFARQKALAADKAESETDSPKSNVPGEQQHIRHAGMEALDYGGGKWGRYLRAPDFYFTLMREFGDHFTRLGEITTIKRGITSGCDAFFMPRNVSDELLKKNPSESEWLNVPLMRRCKRAEVETGAVIIVKCGDNSLHPIESDYIRPEVHSLMQVDRPIVTAEQLDRVVLWVDRPLSELIGTYASSYIKWGSKQTFASNKSKSVPVPERESCASRELWYDVTGARPGIGFWPMAQQYRHIIPENPNALICNHNLFDLHALGLNSRAQQALIPILNSTLVAFVKPYYGRYAGTEGNLKTEVVDTLLVEVPDPRHVSDQILKRLQHSFAAMQKREIGHLVEQEFRNCHTAAEVREAAKLPLQLPAELQQPDRYELDDAVFELLGVQDPKRRSALINQMYREVAQHHRDIRIVEVQKMEQRRGGGTSRVSVMQLALNAWSELDGDLQVPLGEWLRGRVNGAKSVNIPDGEVRLPEVTNLFDANTVYVGKKPPMSLICSSRVEAELIAAIARAGVRGPVSIPIGERDAASLLSDLNKRLNDTSTKFEELAQQYAGTDKVREQLIDLLRRWSVEGQPTST